MRCWLRNPPRKVRTRVALEVLVNCCTEYRDETEKHHKDDSGVENELLYPTPRLEYRTRAAPSKGTTESRATSL